MPRGKPSKEIRKMWRNAAYGIIRSAEKCGFLPPAEFFECVDCGDYSTMYDHRDYRYPLNVEPVCMSCNSRRGKGYIPNTKNVVQRGLRELDRHWYYHLSRISDQEWRARHCPGVETLDEVAKARKQRAKAGK